jgi:hypothetical protein
LAVPLKNWLRLQSAKFEFGAAGVYRPKGDHAWPLVAENQDDLTAKLDSGGHLLPLPREPAALANVLEVAIVDFVLDQLAAIPDAEGVRGAERGYPDLEITGDYFGGGYRAVDVKLARVRVAKGSREPIRTVSRITLYTGNTYFRYPKLPLGGIRRPFDDYEEHLDIIGLYVFNDESKARVEGLELLVQEPWAVASRSRSSTTREYIGAVDRVADLRDGRGEFASSEEFYGFWRAYPFKVPQMLKRELDKLIRERPHHEGPT